MVVEMLPTWKMQEIVSLSVWSALNSDNLPIVASLHLAVAEP